MESMVCNEISFFTVLQSSLLCNKQKGRVGMKKILSFFLVALVFFTFMGCDSSSKVPSEAQAAEIGNVFAAFSYVVNNSDQGVSTSSDGNTRTLTEDIKSDEFTFKAGSYMTYTPDGYGATLDVKYVKGGNHSLYMVGSYS